MAQLMTSMRMKFRYHVFRHFRRATFARLSLRDNLCLGISGFVAVLLRGRPSAIFLLSFKHPISSLNLVARLCPKFRLPPLLLQTSRLSSKRLWKRTRTRQRKTSPPIPWRYNCSLAILPVRFSPCFGHKYRRLIKLKARTTNGQGG